MPARKPASLITRAETLADKAARIAKEQAVKPARPLQVAPPVALKGHAVASATWRRIMGIYRELDDEIVTRLDMDHLVDYCMLTEQTGELDEMCKTLQESYVILKKAQAKAIEEERTTDAVNLAGDIAHGFDGIVKLDARRERKRALLKLFRESLYLTPRARAGVAPANKDLPEPPDPLEQLLGNVTDYVNGDGKQ